MKSTILFLLIICSAFIATAQDISFTTVALQEEDSRITIGFSVQQEVNVKYYRVEASDDNVSFNVIGRITPKGNTMQKVSYSYDLTAYTHTFYRIAIVYMDGKMPYSKVVSKQRVQPSRNSYPNNPQSGATILTVR